MAGHGKEMVRLLWGRMGSPDTALSAYQHLGRDSQKYIHKMDLLEELTYVFQLHIW